MSPIGRKAFSEMIYVQKMERTGKSMSSWKENLRKIEPYVPGEQPNLPDMIKLNTNENPYPPSPMVAKALEKFDPESLRLYPDPESSLLTDAIGKRYGIEKNQVFVGVGSDDVLAIAFMTFFNSKNPFCSPISRIPFTMYGQSSSKSHTNSRLLMRISK